MSGLVPASPRWTRRQAARWIDDWRRLNNGVHVAEDGRLGLYKRLDDPDDMDASDALQARLMRGNGVQAVKAALAAAQTVRAAG